MKFLNTFIFFNLFCSAFSQNPPAAEITVTSTEIQLWSDNYKIRKDSKKNYILLYPETEKLSFWYKITVISDCRFSFKVSSSDSTSWFSLYKDPGFGDFSRELKRKKIIAVRSGQISGEEKHFTKISGGKKTEITDFVQPVTAEKGEIYYLNVHHENETEHFLKMIVSSEIVSFRATHQKFLDADIVVKNETKMEIIKPVAIENKSSEKEIIKLNSSENNLVNNTEKKSGVREISVSSQKKKIEQVTVSGIVVDSITLKPILAELKWTDEITGREIIAHTNPQGEYSIALDEKVVYKLTCATVGYREKTTKFIRQNLNSETLKQDFAMTTLKPGENFVLKHIYFYAGTYAMKPESEPELEKLLSYMQSNLSVKIEIQGHTNGEGKIKKKKDKRKKDEGWDFHGNEKKLSKYRAEAIKTYLVKNGISEERLLAQGMGASKMLYSEPKNQKERDANKRVEVYILSATADLASVLNAISN